MNPHPKRRILLQKEANFRDLGGYRTEDGRMIKWGLLFRSGGLNKLADEDLVQLERIGLQTAVDFRSENELQRLGANRALQGAEIISLPINPEIFTSQLGDALRDDALATITSDFMVQLYRGLIDSCTEQYRDFLNLVADSDKLPLVVHCTHGKDRTGIGVALLLTLLGVPWETIMHDYLLSNHYLQHELAVQKEEMKQVLTKLDGVPLTDQDMGYLAPIFTVDAVYLEGAQRLMVEQYGSVAQFIRMGLGISDAQRDTLREMLLEPAE